MDMTLKSQRVRLIQMSDPDPIQPGEIGEIQFQDGIGQLHVKWESGRTLALIPGEDQFEFIRQ
jgi:hypothetical protein